MDPIRGVSSNGAKNRNKKNKMQYIQSDTLFFPYCTVLFHPSLII